MGTNKYYVVWKGFAPGVYDSWEEAEMQVSGHPDASYRAFKTMEAAVEAFREGFDKESLIKEVAREMERLEKEGTVIEFDKKKSSKADMPKAEAPAEAPAPAKTTTPTEKTTPTETTPPGKKRVIVQQPPPYLVDSLAVDAACAGNPGPMEYRGVLVRTGQEIFHVGPMEGGTNNIGEFLAIGNQQHRRIPRHRPWPRLAGKTGHSAAHLQRFGERPKMDSHRHLQDPT